MARWRIGRVRAVPPAPGTDCEAAYAIHFREDDQPEPQITVEYAAGSGHASAGHARSAVQPYLDQEQPPRRLVVDRDGNVRPRDEPVLG